jgi:hypothetical protein
VQILRTEEETRRTMTAAEVRQALEGLMVWATAQRELDTRFAKEPRFDKASRAFWEGRAEGTLRVQGKIAEMLWRLDAACETDAPAGWAANAVADDEGGMLNYDADKKEG